MPVWRLGGALMACTARWAKNGLSQMSPKSTYTLSSIQLLLTL